MQKKDIPQDDSSLKKFTKEVCYAVDENGNYTTSLSTGWEVKTLALDKTWEDIERRANAAREKAKSGTVSPLLFFMELRIMDLATLAAYTGFFKWQIKRHMNPVHFQHLSERRLKIYAEAFEVSIEELKNMNVK